jgi:hypothetical protein
LTEIQGIFDILIVIKTIGSKTSPYFTSAVAWREQFSRIESVGEGCNLIDRAIAKLNLENENIYR